MGRRGLLSLYPDALHKAKVGFLTIPGLANPRATGFPNVGDIDSYYGSNIVARSRSGFLVFVRKAFPHSPFDCLAVTNRTPDIATSVDELGRHGWSELAQVIQSFHQFVRDDSVQRAYRLRDGEPHVTFNYAGRRQDREDSMYYDRRLHVHLNYFTRSSLRSIEYRNFRSVSTVDKVRLVDPGFIVGAQVLTSFLRSTEKLENLRPWPSEESRAGVNGGQAVGAWFSCEERLLSDERTWLDLCAIHSSLRSLYDQVSAAFLESQSREPWTRGALRSRQEILRRVAGISGLDDGAIALLAALAGVLREHPPGLEPVAEEIPVRLTLPDLDYSVTIRHHPKDREFRILVQPRLLSDTGAAGTPGLAGLRAVKIMRSRSVLFEPEMERLRDGFRDEFVRSL